MNDTAITLVSARNLITFDYDCLPKAQANTLRKAAERIRKTGHDAFLEIGRELLTAKEWLKHGQFEHWVENECHLGIRSAERAIQAARVVAKNDKLSPLAVDALIALSGAPDEIIEEVVREIGAGRFPTSKSIRHCITNSAGADADEKDEQPASELPTSDMKSRPVSQANETEPGEVAPSALDDLTALWNRADAETRASFRQHIGCGGDFTVPGPEVATENAA